MEEYLSPKQVALAIGVSEASIKRWCDRGLIKTGRTGGGHRRLHRADVLSFLRQDRIAIVRPELLGLPPMTGSAEETTRNVLDDLKDALTSGNRNRVRSLILNYYISGRSAVETCDALVAPAFHNVGDRWKCGEIDVFEERRACEIALSALHELYNLIPEPETPTISAVCATLKSDIYEIPLALVAITLKENNCRVEKIGTNLPAKSLEKAIETIEPQIFCLSISYIDSSSGFKEELARLHQKSKECNCAFVVGGRALTDEIRKGISYDVFCDDLSRLAAFVSTFKNVRSS